MKIVPLTCIFSFSSPNSTFSNGGGGGEDQEEAIPLLSLRYTVYTSSRKEVRGDMSTKGSVAGSGPRATNEPGRGAAGRSRRRHLSVMPATASSPRGTAAVRSHHHNHVSLRLVWFFIFKAVHHHQMKKSRIFPPHPPPSSANHYVERENVCLL